MHFFSDYFLFLAKISTVVVAILIVVSAIILITQKAKGGDKDGGTLIIKKLNTLYQNMTEMVNHAILTKKEKKALKKAKKSKKSKKNATAHEKRIFVITFNGDIKASAVSALREEVTAVLLTANKNDEVLVKIESPGGLVNAYGLAASQLQRIKDAGIKLTVAVDKVAASGGYMMACVADTIIAAPFAILGSIGVVSQLPNFHRFLDKHKVDFEQITAGEYKRTLTMLGKNTSKDREKAQDDVNEVHHLFKNFVSEHRSQLDIDRVATGEYWFGTRAFELRLVDELKTSDDFLLNAKDKFSLYEVEYRIKQPLKKRLSVGFNSLLTSILHRDSTITGGDYI